MTSSDAPSDLSGTSLGERKLIAVLYGWLTYKSLTQKSTFVPGA